MVDPFSVVAVSLFSASPSSQNELLIDGWPRRDRGNLVACSILLKIIDIGDG